MGGRPATALEGQSATGSASTFSSMSSLSSMSAACSDPAGLAAQAGALPVSSSTSSALACATRSAAAAPCRCGSLPSPSRRRADAAGRAQAVSILGCLGLEARSSQPCDRSPPAWRGDRFFESAGSAQSARHRLSTGGGGALGRRLGIGRQCKGHLNTSTRITMMRMRTRTPPLM